MLRRDALRIKEYQMGARCLELAENVIKYHRIISTYINDLIEAGFVLKTVEEPMSSEDMLKSNPIMKDEKRRPMFVTISVEKEE